MNKRILIIKHRYSDYSEDRSDFISKATEADSLWSEVSDSEYREITKLVNEHNNQHKYTEQDHENYEIIEYVDPKSVLTKLADELKLKVKERLEQERKQREKAEKRRKTLEARELEKDRKKLEELKAKFEKVI